MRTEGEKIVSDLKKLKNKTNIVGMARFGINPETALGIKVTYLRKKAKTIGTNHQLALELWNSNIHEARILATMVDESSKVTSGQMNSWVNDFNSWDLCDQCCNNLFRKTPHAIDYSFKWVNSKKEYVKRAGFVLIAVLAFHNKQMTNKDFSKYFPIIVEHSTDERNFVIKAVNWSLRQIGKRNTVLNKEAIQICNILINSDSKSSKWIGQNALKELSSENIIKRLN